MNKQHQFWITTLVTMWLKSIHSTGQISAIDSAITYTQTQYSSRGGFLTNAMTGLKLNDGTDMQLSSVGHCLMFVYGKTHRGLTSGLP